MSNEIKQPADGVLVKEPKGKFIGWRMVVVCGLIYAFVGALGLTVGQLTLSYMVLDPEVTMNRTALGLGFTLFILAQGLPGPIIGQLVVKKGARFAYICGSIIAAIMGVLLALFLGHSTLFYLIGFGVCLSIGCTTAGQIPGQSTLNNWFVAKRGKAISTMMMMAAIIGCFYPLITNALINIYGWRVGFVLIAAFALVGLVLAIFFVKNKPADVGQMPDGEEMIEPDGTVEEVRNPRIYQTVDHKTLKQTVKTPAFWLIVFTAFTCFAHLNLNVSQGGLFCVSQGHSLDLVSFALSWKTACGIVLLLCLSFILDRIEPIRVHGVATLIGGIGALLAAFFGESIVIIFVYYACVAIAYGTQTVAMPTELANMFGNTHYPQIIGLVLPIVAVAASFVPTIAGAVFDATGSYVPAFIGLGVIGILGFIASCLVRIPKNDETPVEE